MLPLPTVFFLCTFFGDSCRTLVHMDTTIAKTVCSGSDDFDVEFFLFTNNSVVLPGKKREDNTACLLAHLSEEARTAHHSKFIHG